MRKIDKNPFPFALWPNQQRLAKSKTIEFHDASADDLHHLDNAEQGKDPQHIPTLSPIGAPSSSGIDPAWTIPEEHRAKWHELMAIENNRRLQQFSDLIEERKMHLQNGDANFGEYARTFYNMARGERHRIARFRNAYLDQQNVDFKNDLSKPTLLMDNNRPVDVLGSLPREIIPAMNNKDTIDYGPKYEFHEDFIPSEFEDMYPGRTTEPLGYGPVKSKYFLPLGHNKEEQPESNLNIVQSGQRPSYAHSRGQFSPQIKAILKDMYKNQGQWAVKSDYNGQQVPSSVLLNVPSPMSIFQDIDAQAQNIDLQTVFDALANEQQTIDPDVPRGTEVAYRNYQSPHEQLLLHQAWKHQRMSELTDENIPAMLAALHAASTYHEREFGKRKGWRLPAGIRDIENLSPDSTRENWTSRPADIHVQYPDLPPTIITAYHGKPSNGSIKSGYVPISQELQQAYSSGTGTVPSVMGGSPVPDYSHWGPLAEKARMSDRQLFNDLSERMLDPQSKEIIEKNNDAYVDESRIIQPVNFDYRIRTLNPQTIAKFFRGMSLYNEDVLIIDQIMKDRVKKWHEEHEARWAEFRPEIEQEKGTSEDEPYF